MNPNLKNLNFFFRGGEGGMEGEWGEGGTMLSELFLQRIQI